MDIPQLRIRTEYSFKQAYGPVPRVIAALKEINCPAAGIVDIGGTWGHFDWSKNLKAAGIKPLFGTEVAIQDGDGRRPTFWVLAEDMKLFYNFSTLAQRKETMDMHWLAKDSSGIIRFAGAALADPECFDYIDINPGSPLQQQAALRLHKRTGMPLVVTSDNAYPKITDKGAFLALSGRERATPQHILHTDELRAALLCLDDNQFSIACMNAVEISERCCSDLPQAGLVKVEGDLRALTLAGKEMRIRLGHIKSWTPEYEARMERELELIFQKEFQSYFLVVSDLVGWAKKRMLVGPGRGSSAGSLVCYLLRITEVDSIIHNLLFERFIDAERSDWPDIDIDFSDSKRELCFKYLSEKYGSDKVARMGNINSVRPRSVIAKVCDRLDIPIEEKFDILNVLIEYSSGDARYGHSLEDTTAQTDPGRRFAAAHPEAMELFQIENHATHTGVHAAGVIVANEPISDYCTVGVDGITQADKHYVEGISLLKIDALGLRTLGVIEDSDCITSDELYALTLDDPNVFDLFNSRRYAGIFQFEGQAQRNVSSKIHIDSFRIIDHCTALARPGPLGGGAAQHYIARAAGREEITYHHPSMETYLGPTMGVVLYQEQVMRIVKEIGKFDWKGTNAIRKAMSGRKGKEYFDQRRAIFVEGAATIGMSEQDAVEIWEEICSHGAWSMNQSHTASYSIISYWCSHMKVYFPMQYAAACLRNAKDDEQCLELLRDMAGEGIMHVAFDVDKSGIDWAAVDGKLVGGFMNLEGYGPAKSTKAVADRAAGKLDKEKIAKAVVKFSELYPLSKKYKDMYDNPENYGCQSGSVISRLDALPYEGDTLVIAKVLRKELRDEMETVRANKRRGKPPITGPTIFLDIFVADDSGVPITLRINRFKFEPFGRKAAELLQAGDEVLCRGKRIPNFSMIQVLRLKVLNREVTL